MKRTLQLLGAACLFVLVSSCSSTSDAPRGHRTLQDGRSVSIWEDGSTGEKYYVDGEGRHPIK